MESLKVSCRTPTKGRLGETRIPKWKYECLSTAILRVLDEAKDGRVKFSELANLVKPHLTPEELDSLGSLNWHVTTVKLDMEVQGVIQRIDGMKPQLLQRMPTP